MQKLIEIIMQFTSFHVIDSEHYNITDLWRPPPPAPHPGPLPVVPADRMQPEG